MADVDRERWELIAQAHVIDPVGCREILQLAPAVHHTDGADVVSFCQQKFDDQLAMRLQFRSGGSNHHAFLDGSEAGGLQSVLPFDLDQTKAAGSYVTESAYVAQARDLNAMIPRNGEDRVAGHASHHLAIDLERFDAHVIASSGWLSI